MSRLATQLLAGLCRAGVASLWFVGVGEASRGVALVKKSNVSI